MRDTRDTEDETARLNFGSPPDEQSAKGPAASRHEVAVLAVSDGCVF